MWQFAIFAGDKMGLGVIKLGMRLPFASAFRFSYLWLRRIGKMQASLLLPSLIRIFTAG